MATKRRSTPRRAPSKTVARPQPLIAVKDVRASSRWYSKLLAGERTSQIFASDHDHLYDRIPVLSFSSSMPGTRKITRTW
jgi:hypothetical protein